MFKNSIVVLNIGNVMCDNARNSIIDACKRWNCNFYEITENLVGYKNVCFNKIVGINDYCKSNPTVERIMYLDADVLIRDNTPNPFELFIDKNKVYAVLDYNTGWITKELYIQRIVEPWLKIVQNTLKYDVDINDLISTSCNWFFNAGMFIFTPSNFKHEIDTFINNIPLIFNHSHLEQAMWNYILKCGNKVELIDSTWNLLNPPTSLNKMDAYIYHFTGTRFAELKPLLPTFNWKNKKNILNKNFDKVFCITIPEDIDRQNRCRNQFSRYNIEYEFVPAVNKKYLHKCDKISDGEFSLLLTYISCFQSAKLNKLDKIIIFEDDIVLYNDWQERLDLFLKELPKNWNLLYLGKPKWTDGIYDLVKKDYSEHISICKYGPGAHFMGYNKCIYDEIINKSLLLEDPIDIVYYYNFMKKTDMCFSLKDGSLADAISMPHKKYHDRILNFNKNDYISSHLRETSPSA